MRLGRINHFVSASVELSGCSAPPDAKPVTAGKPFLDEKKQIAPRKEWNREVTSRTGGKITFRVTSEGPFAVTVVTGNGYKAMKSGDKQAFNKTDVRLTHDSPTPSHEAQVIRPAGSSYFIIENQATKPATIHIECFAPG